MSVLLEFAMFPTDKGDSVSAYVARIIEMIDGAALAYQLTPMGTIVETETVEEALSVVREAFRKLEPDCARIYSSIKLDIRKDRGGRLRQKIESVEAKVGKKLNT